ncbi:MAG: hypothetical protein Q4C44_00670 [bacterium]|nr:hypothetical protein [bacterium]
MKNKNVSFILLLSVFVVITGVIFLKNYETETLVDAKWNEKEEALLAITIDGKESDKFPTTSSYIGVVTCSKGSGTAVWNGSKWVFNVTSITQNKTKCNVDFTKSSTVYDKVLADYAKNNGVQKTTDENGKDVYYYAGNITNNNLVLNNYCWKMVRTTETDGVKLIYNGLYKEDTKCNNTGTDVYLEASGTRYNSNRNGSLAYVGYMYGTVYATSEKIVSSFGKYYYGSNVTWNGTTYTLSNAESVAVANINSKLRNKHYTCLSTSTRCSTVYYISYVGTLPGGSVEYAYYITLKNGKKIENAIDEMLNYNTTNSNIKKVIDNWYSSNMTNITNYLENAIYCNNRYITNLSASAWNPSGGSITTDLHFNDFDEKNLRLTCQDKEDQFTLKVDSGGTLGYGNNALDYPVGLLTTKEAKLAFYGSSTNYLNNNGKYWLMSPYRYSYDDAGIRGQRYGELSAILTITDYGARPAITLKQNILITGGTGEIEDPYTVALPD